MIKFVSIAELTRLPINWVRGDDDRLKTVLKSLNKNMKINDPIQLMNCGCGKTYILEDGGHRLTAAYKVYKKTGREIMIPVEIHVSKIK